MPDLKRILPLTLAFAALPLASLADGFYWNGDNATGALDDTAMWLYGGREDYTTLTATNALPTAEDDVTVIGRTNKTSSVTLASGHSFNAKNFYLGHGWGNVATLTTEGNVTIAGATEIGYYNDGHGTLIQNGGSWTTADLKMGTSNCADSHLIVSNGTFTVNAGDGTPKIAESDNSQVELLIDGGAMVINGNPICGHANGAQANVTVSSGSLTVNGRYFNFGNKNSSVNTMTINGGEVSVDCPNFGFQLSAMSTVNLNGGTLRVHNTQHDGDRAEDVDVINFNGGVLADFASDASRSDDLIGNNSEITLNVLAGGVVIATDNNRTIKKAFTGSEGDGGFTKRGTGTLTLSGAAGWNGATTVEGGILKLASAPTGKNLVVVPVTTSSETAPLQFTGSVDLSTYTIDVPEGTVLDTTATYYLYNTANVTAAPTLGSRLAAAGFTLNSDGSVGVVSVTTSDYYWKGGVDGNWETSGNWANSSGETVTSGHPGSGVSDKLYVNASNDTAVALNGDYTITHLYAGNAANANGYMQIDGTGSLKVSSVFNIGDAAAGSTGIVSVAGGKVFAPVNMKIGNNDGYGKLSIDGGEFNVTSTWVNVGNNNSSQEAAILEVNDGVAEIFVQNNSYGINMQGSSAEGKGKAYVNLNGGVLKTTRFYGGNGDKAGHIINLNGGTLMPLLANYNGGNFMPNDFTVNVLEGGAKFDTAGIDIEVKADLSGVGGITKSGEGTLNVSGASSFTGDVVVSNGVLALKTGTTSANYAVYPSADAAPLQIAGSVNLAGDTMTILAEESELSEDVNYLLMTAQSITGTPTLSNTFEEPWYLQNTGSSLYLRLYHDGDDTNTYERATLSYSKSAYDATTKTWTDDSYSVYSEIGVGGDSIWKISGNYMNTATYTISVPADVEVHYVTYLNAVESYGNSGTVSFVSSGAVCTLSTNVIDGTKRDIVASFSGHTAGTPISFTLTGLHTVMIDKIQIDYLAKPLETAPVLKSWKVTDTTDRNHFALMLSYDRVMTNATATVNGTTTVEAEPGAVLLFPVWDLDYSSTATVSILADDVKDIYGNKISSNLTFSVEIGAKPTATKAAPIVVNDFTSLSNAVAALNIENASATAARKVIYLRDGDYACESNRLFITGCNITFLGESTNVFIHGNTVLTSTTAPVQIEDSAKGIVFQNMVIRNDNTFRTGEFGGQSLAVKGGDHTVFDNVYLQSNQDTFLANGPLYYRGGEICGTVDFIYGDGNMFFTNTLLTVEDRKGNVILAPGTSPTVEWGIVLAGCTIDAAPGAVNDLNGTFTLGRPWKSEPRGYYLNTTMKIVPSEGGWGGMSKLYTHMYEYGSVDAKGKPIDLTNRESSSSSLNEYYPVLTDEEAAKITCRNVLDGRDSWDPTEHLAEVTKPVLAVNGGRVSWTDDPYTSCYIVLADGAFAAATTANQYKATIGVKSVQVIALNASGTVGAASDAVPVKVPGLIISVW